MATNSFEKNILGWQREQLQQRFWAWWELQTSQFSLKLPKASVPSWLDSPILSFIAKAAFWLVLALLLSWVGLQIVRLLSPYFYSLKNQLSQPDDKARQTSGSELSVAGWLDVVWLERSQKFQQQGNYREACLCLYRAMLQRLNDAGIAPHQSSRTDVSTTRPAATSAAALPNVAHDSTTIMF